MSIIDLKGKVLVGAGWQKVCLDFHRAKAESCCNCIESDLKLTERISPGEFRLYKCKNNMWDVATPLIIGGQHVGNVFSGQFFFDDEPIDRELFREQARRYGYDEQEYLNALEAAPRLSRSTVEAGMAYLVKCAQFLSLLGLRNRELAQTVAERDVLMRGLLESEERLRKAQAIAHVGSWELDLTADRLTWSDEVYRIFGLQPQEFKATYEAFLERIHSEDREAVNAAYLGSVRDGRDSYQITHRVIRNATGEIRWVQEKCEHLRDASGAIVRSIGMVQDITEERLAEEKLRHKQKLESIGLLAAGVAHDFNNLLVAVIGNASLARQMLGDSHPVVEVLDGVITAGQRAADLTRQMLAYAGKGRFVVKSIDLNSLVQEISGFAQASFSKKVTLTLSLDDQLPLVQGDPGQMQQVLMNLIINAAEAIGDNPGLVSVRTFKGNGAEAPDQEVQLPADSVCIEVSDTGCGMNAETQSKIFDPFFSTKFAGRGLGLAGVAGIVRGHNGAIQVKSVPNRGTTFTVWFPASEGTERETPAASSRPATDAKGTGTVLVVDDEELVRKFLVKAVKAAGYSVLAAAGGEEAVELCAGNSGIDVVLLDSNMPGMSGADTLTELLGHRPDLKVIVTSGYDETETLGRFEDRRVAAFIQKPYVVSALIDVLRRVVDG